MAAEILEIWIWTGSVSSGYIFYVLVTIVSFFLIVETREGMLVCLKKSASFVLFGFSFSVFFSFPWISKRWSSSYSSLIRLPNCLLTLPETTELYVIIAKHWPTVCQLDWRLTNCLPTSWHSEHQINSFHRVRSTEMVIIRITVLYLEGFSYPPFHGAISHSSTTNILMKVSERKYYIYITFITRKSDNSQMLKTASLRRYGNFLNVQ